MTTHFLASLVVALALAGCGGDEPHKAPTAATPPAAQKPATPPAAAPAAQKPATPPATAKGPASVCIAQWTSGATGALTCSGPVKDAPFDKAAFRLDHICVNDRRISTYTAGGKTVTMQLKAEKQQLCASLGGVAEVPESCSCVAPAGGDCNPPKDGFVCVAVGHSANGGG